MCSSSIGNRIFRIDFACPAAVCSQRDSQGCKQNESTPCWPWASSHHVKQVSDSFMFGHSQEDKSATVFCWCTELPQAMQEKRFFLIFGPESVYATKCILVNTDRTLLSCSWEGNGVTCLDAAAGHLQRKSNQGETPLFFALMLFVLLFDFSPLCLCIFFNSGRLGRWGAHFKAFCPFKASSD